MSGESSILTFRFSAAGSFPNNPTLPVLVYQQVAQSAGRAEVEDIAAWFESTWRQHGWCPAWRYGVYNFPHYHSTAHEILGIYRGQASLRLGHRTGATLDVNPGDMIVLPAGTTHENLGSSADFQVVGGYPENQDADLLRGDPAEFSAAVKRIAQVPRPRADPVFGASGPLVKHWRENTAARPDR